MFDITAHKSRLVLELSTRALESVVGGKGQVGVQFIQLRGTSDVDLPTVRERQPNAHLILTAGLVMVARTFDHDASGSGPTKAALQLRDMLLNGSPDFGRD